MSYAMNITGPAATVFAQRYASALPAIRKEYDHAYSNGLRSSFEQFLTRTAEGIERETGRFVLPKAIEFAEKHAADMPSVYMDFKRDSRIGAVRLTFEQYLANIAAQRYEAKERAFRS